MQFVDLKKFNCHIFIFTIAIFIPYPCFRIFYFFSIIHNKIPTKNSKIQCFLIKNKTHCPPSFILISASFVFKSTFLITPCKLGFDSFSTPPSGAGNIHRLRTLAFAHPITQIRMHTPMLIALTCLKTFISNSLSRMRIHPTCHFLTQLIYIFILCTGTSHSWFPALSRSIRIAQR